MKGDFFGADPTMRMSGRGDTMSLNTVNARADHVKVTTTKFCTKRALSNNLNTDDIAGKSSIFRLA